MPGAVSTEVERRDRKVGINRGMVSQRASQVLDFLAPPALREGDTISVVAPAGPFDRAQFWRGMGWLSEHFALRFADDIRARDGFVAGSRERRLHELNLALTRQDSRAIVCARGGYGSGELSTHAAFNQLRNRPQWLIGFSDVTLLHVEAQRHGVRSIHAHNVTGLGLGDADERERWLQAVLEPCAARSFVLAEQHGPARSGALLGGNLTLIHHAALSGRFRPTAGCLLFLEEVAEAPYRIARLLSGLEAGGVFDAISALIVGQVTPAEADRSGVTAKQVFEACARRNNLSLGWGLQSGHLRPNLPLQLGAPATLRGGLLHVG